ncbi:DUF883 domain-containing protein [Dyella sp. M7H15-1]|uniref:DUF883 family protein n=1 Tax=Dyella sp. M7H15-1 TaxID=2501295 RepID=UPI001004ECF3|nr:DUF883 family protein [Dyella sp. M7H15-1]QAU24618.1 DUF883 domain-containing protein [Dyella sp. M7H15-1]
MNKEVQAHETHEHEHEHNIHERIDHGAERIKQATSDAVANSKDKFGRVADHLEDGLHRATDKAAHAANRASDKVDEAKERGRAAYGQARDRADEWLDEVRDYVREKPVQAVAIALGAGWLLGRILRR